VPSVPLRARIDFTYQGLLIVQRPRLHPFLRRRGRRGRHLRSLPSRLRLPLGLWPGLGPRPVEPTPAPVRSLQLGRLSEECGGIRAGAAGSASCSRPLLGGRDEGGALCAAPPAGPSGGAGPARLGSAVGPPPGLGRGGRGRLERATRRSLAEEACG
jgi:hypothetical protein